MQTSSMKGSELFLNENPKYPTVAASRNHVCRVEENQVQTARNSECRPSVRLSNVRLCYTVCQARPQHDPSVSERLVCSLITNILLDLSSESDRSANVSKSPPVTVNIRLHVTVLQYAFIRSAHFNAMTAPCGLRG